MNDLYGKSVLKLAVLYTSILAIISLFFSVNLYFTATNEISRALDRQERQLSQRGFRKPAIDELRLEQFQEAKAGIAGRLILTNVIIISLGGAGSYLLARRTLQPIKDAHDAQLRFTSDASHELRTPLTALISETEVALRDRRLTKQQATSILRSNLEEIRAMANLTDNLLMLTKNETIARADFTPFSLKSVLTQTAKKYQKEAQKKQITIKTVCSKDVRVQAHEPSLRQIIGILLDNAIKYSRQNATVKISATTGRRHTLVSVKDHGPGIAPHDLSHVFDRFYQADASRGKEPGFGLGLSIAQRLAHAQGMHLKVHSKLGSGSTFSIEVPLA